MTQPAPSPTPGPITLEDVRAALGGANPFATNAGALRQALGRGSNATVQKHLEALRAEKQAAWAPTERAAVPPPPPDSMTTLWSVAYVAAEAVVRARLDMVTAQRDALAQREAAMALDIQALNEQLGAAAQAAVDAQAKTSDLCVERDAALGRERELAAQAAAAATAARTELRDAATRVQTVGDALDRAGQREGELRAQLTDAARRNDELVNRLAALAARRSD